MFGSLRTKRKKEAHAHAHARTRTRTCAHARMHAARFLAYHHGLSHQSAYCLGKLDLSMFGSSRTKRKKHSSQHLDHEYYVHIMYMPQLVGKSPIPPAYPQIMPDCDARTCQLLNRRRHGHRGRLGGSSPRTRYSLHIHIRHKLRIA